MPQNRILPRLFVLLGALAQLAGCKPPEVVIVDGEGQTGLIGYAVNVPPAVMVRSSSDKPMAGVPVRFEVTAGSGSVNQATVMTDASGVARVGAWVIGEGANSLTATAEIEGADGNPATFTATGTPSSFNIQLRYLSDLTATQRVAFEDAAARWSRLIIGDLPEVMLNLPAGACLPSAPAIDERVDDVIIYVSVESIDGPGQILGAAGPCIIRNTSTQATTALGGMRFDSADLAVLEQRGELGLVILHEMGHVIGFGSLWEQRRLLVNPSLPNRAGVDTSFSGQRAITSFDGLGGTSYSGAKVPVENGLGGQGTRDSHWRESVFNTELMTGFLDPGTQDPLSRVSVASLWDLGYQVNLAGADDFTLGAGRVAASSARRIALPDDILRVPIRVVDDSGRIVDEF